jgi:GNAT superfamily N-acetyltransferase
MFDVELKRVIDLTPEEESRCRELSYGSEGYMCEDLDSILINERIKRPYRYSHVYLVTESNEIIGWSLLQPRYRSPLHTAQLFVDPKYRGKGIGTTLLSLAWYFGKRKPVVYIDDDNEGFFKKNSHLYTEVR